MLRVRNFCTQAQWLISALADLQFSFFNCVSFSVYGSFAVIVIRRVERNDVSACYCLLQFTDCNLLTLYHASGRFRVCDRIDYNLAFFSPSATQINRSLRFNDTKQHPGASSVFSNHSHEDKTLINSHFCFNKLHQASYRMCLHCWRNRCLQWVFNNFDHQQFFNTKHWNKRITIVIN